MKSTVKLIDGGLGTEISRLGYEINNNPLWNSTFLHTNPEVLKNAHLNFLNAGCDIIITSSYQANVEEFIKHLTVNRETAISLLASSVDIAHDAIKKSQGPQTNHLVAASIGPYGACLHDGSEYTGNYVDTISIKTLKEWHKLRMQVVASRNPDLFAIETIPSLKEAKVLMELLRDFPNTKAWLSFACKDEKTTCYGDSFVECVKEASKCEQIIAVGVNCSNPNIVLPMIKSVQELLTNAMNFIAYPNSGEEFNSNGVVGWDWKSGDKNIKHDLPELAASWLQTGKVGYVGGCCRITPDDISQLRTVVDDWNNR